METAPQDRLAKLFADKPLPTTNVSAEPHFSEKELREKRQKDQAQPKWQLPAAAVYPRRITKPVKPQPTTEILTSSDDDDYTSSFAKKPSMKPPSPQSSKSKRRFMHSSDAPGHMADTKPSPQGGIEYIHKGKSSSKQSSHGPSIGQKNVRTTNDRSSDLAPLPIIGKFCQFGLAAKFPYKYMNDNNDRVSRHFFADNKFFSRSWELHYLIPPYSLGGKPLVLVPYAQFQALVKDISDKFKIDASVPEFPFTLTFRDDGTPQPQYLGISHSRDEAADLQSSIPFASLGHGESPDNASSASKQHYEDFKEMCQEAMIASKKKGTAIKKKGEQDRLLNVGDLHKQLRRCQRYLGLRPRIGRVRDPDPALSWYEQEDFRVRQLKEARIILDPLDVHNPNLYPFDQETVLISFDVEAYERAHNLITEIGVSTLDTLDLVSLPPGIGGVNWINQIRSRHFRIKGREHLVNRDFCPGNPDAFQFGRSEFIDLSEAAEQVDSCFKWPFSVQFKHASLVDPWTLPANDGNVGTTSSHQMINDSHFGGVSIGPSNQEQEEANIAAVESVLNGQGDPALIQRAIEMSKASQTNLEETMQRGPKHRNILIVGHAVAADLKFLKEIGSKIFSSSRATYPVAAMDMMGTGEGDANVLASILEALDTGPLYRILKKETQNRNLASILGDLGRPCLFMHNGGNDARYTLEALVAMVVKSRLLDDEVPMQGQAQTTEDRTDEWVNETTTKGQDEEQDDEARSNTGQAVFATSLPLMTKPKKEDLDAFEAAICASSDSEASPPRQTDHNITSLLEKMKFEDGGDPKGLFGKSTTGGK